MWFIQSPPDPPLNLDYGIVGLGIIFEQPAAFIHDLGRHFGSCDEAYVQSINRYVASYFVQDNSWIGQNPYSHS